MSCPTCNGTGYDPHNGGHIFNNQEEMDATHEHQCVHCPVPCPDCGGSGDDPMSDLPTKEWFTKVDSVTSLVGHRRYGLTDDDLASQLIEISGEARMFAKTVGEETPND